MSCACRAGRLGVALALSFAVVSCSADPEVRKRQYLESGNKHFEEKRYREAILEYRNALQADPRFAEASSQLTQAYLRAGDSPRAVREAVRAADLLPDDIAAQALAGRLLLLAGRFEDAKARATKVLARDPKHVEAQIVVGNALAGLKDLDGAIAQAEEAIRLDPMQSRLHQQLGAFELAQGRRDEAEASLKKATQIDPTSPTAQLALGGFYWVTGRAPEAEASLKAAVALSPKHVLAHRALGNLYLVTRRPAEAEKHFKALAEGTDDAGPHLALADYYVLVGRGPEAQKVLQAITDPAAAGAVGTRLAAIEYGQGRPTEAHKILDGVLAKEANNPRALILKSRFLLLEGQADLALTRAQAAVAADPKSPAGHFTLGLVQTAKNDVEEATKAFNEVLRLNPRASAAQLELSRLHLARGSVDTSLRFAESAVQNAPRSVVARLMLARGLMSDGKLARAEAELVPVAKQYPNVPVVQAQMGTLQLLKKDGAAAKQSFERALSVDPGNFEANRGLVTLDVGAKRFREARARLKALLDKKPNDAQLLILSATVYGAEGDLAGAEAALRRAVAANPSDVRAYGMLGQLYVRQRRLDEAKAEFAAIARQQPGSVSARTMIAIILETQNKHADAQKEYEAILQIDSKAAVAANNLAWLYAERGGNLDIALQLAQTAKAHLPDKPEVNDTLGWVYYKKDLTPQAVRYLRESVTSDPNNPMYHYHLGLAYEKNGESAKAKQSLERALQLNPQFDGADAARKALASLKG